MERIWGTGVLQSLALDLVGLVGASVIGVGIWAYSRPAALIYAGAILVAGSVLVGIERTRRAAEQRRQEDRP